ncbi:MAG: Hemin transport system permease protein HmuU, partial [Planctomycetota bacterium]
MKKANAAAGGHAARGFTILLAALALAALLRAAIGPVATDGGTTLTLALPRAEVLSLRLSAIASAALLGAALGLSGLALQILLRNPLASPFVLGVSSGAGFGVSLVLAAAYATGLPALAFGGEFGGAVAGALLTLALVAWLGRARGGGSDPTTLVLAGVITGSVFSAGSMLVEQLVPFGLRGDLLSWMAGRIPELPSRASLATLAVLVAAGVTLLATRARALDVSMLSDEEALTSGVHLRRLRAELFITGGVLAAAAVAYAGPIGFVGLGLYPVLAAVVVFTVARRVTNFALSRPAREALYVPLSRAEKYKAKNLIDILAVSKSNIMYSHSSLLQNVK